MFNLNDIVKYNTDSSNKHLIYRINNDNTCIIATIKNGGTITYDVTIDKLTKIDDVDLTPEEKSIKDRLIDLNPFLSVEQIHNLRSAPSKTEAVRNISKYKVGNIWSNNPTTYITGVTKTHNSGRGNVTFSGGLNSHKKKSKKLSKKKPKKSIKKKSTKKSTSKSTPKKHKGPRGGVYIIRKGRKIYQ